MLLDPILILGDLDVHPRNISLAAANSPRDDSSELPEAGAVVLADQGAATITLASVFALLATGAEESVVEGEVEAKLGVLQQPLASVTNSSFNELLILNIAVICASYLSFPIIGTSTSLRTCW